MDKKQLLNKAIEQSDEIDALRATLVDLLAKQSRDRNPFLSKAFDHAKKGNYVKFYNNVVDLLCRGHIVMEDPTVQALDVIIRQFLGKQVNVRHF